MMLRLFKYILFISIYLALIGNASAQTTCPLQSNPQFTAGGSVFGRIAAQWNAYFGAKVDTNNGCLSNVTIIGQANFGLTSLNVQGPITATGPETIGNVIISSNGITISGFPVSTGITSGSPNIVVSAISPPGFQSVATTINLNIQSGVNYQIQPSDNNTQIQLVNSSGNTSVTILPPATTGYGLGFGTTVCAINQSATITPSVGTLINGVASLGISAKQCVDIDSDGTNYLGILSASNLNASVTNVTQLRASSTTWYPFGVTRLTDGVAGAPPLFFKVGSGVCSTDDGASCVNSLDGNHWNGVFSGKADVREWSAVPGTDATIQIQAALNAGITVPITLAGLNYNINSTGLTCNKLLTLDGENPSTPSVNGNGGSGGFVSLTLNETILTLDSGCAGSRFQNLWFNMNTPGVNTSGAAISMAGSPAQVLFDNIQSSGACVGIDLDGNNDWVTRSFLLHMVGGTSCAGIRIGEYSSTSSPTVGGGVLYTTIQSGSTPPSQAQDGMLILDAGGEFLAHNDILYSVYGTRIFPGEDGTANQAVSWLTAVNTVLGDTTSSSPLVIDTGNSTAIVKGIACTQCWVASTATAGKFGTPNTNPNVVISNDAGAAPANFVGFMFNAMRNYGGYDGFDINAGANVDINNSHICGTGIGATTGQYYGINLGSGENSVNIIGNTIYPVCDSQVGAGGTATGYGINFSSNNQTNITLTNNDLHGNISGPFNGSPAYTSGLAQTNVIANNKGVYFSTLAAAATLTLPVTDQINLNGSAVNISTMNTCWPGRKLTIIPTGVYNFVTGGNIAAAFTTTANVPVTAYCGFTSTTGLWYLK